MSEEMLEWGSMGMTKADIILLEGRLDKIEEKLDLVISSVARLTAMVWEKRKVSAIGSVKCACADIKG